MDIISIVVAGSALVLSLVTYFEHDRKLKKQEKLLNDYNLRVMEQSEAENKKAVIRARVVKPSSGNRTLYIYNTGKVKARNLTVDLPNHDEILVSTPEFPKTFEELLPDAYREFHLILLQGGEELTITYTWDDDFSKDNKESQTIDL